MKAFKSLLKFFLLTCIIECSTLFAQDIPKIDSSQFTIIEQMPQFPGGDEARIKFLNENIKYPEDARVKGIEGRVYVTFIVEKDGSISNVELINGIGSGCDEEAIRLVTIMRNFEPGIQLDEPVRVQFNMPVLFKLSGKTINNNPVFTKDVDYSKGIKNLEQGYFNTASKLFSKSIKRDGLSKNESYAKRALCYYKLGKINEALSDMEIARSFEDIKINRTIASLYLNMGNDAEEINEHEKALYYYNTGVETDSGDTELLLKRGKLHLILKNIDKACSDFTRAYNLGVEEAKSLIDETCE